MTAQRHHRVGGGAEQFPGHQVGGYPGAPVEQPARLAGRLQGEGPQHRDEGGPCRVDGFATGDVGGRTGEHRDGGQPAGDRIPRRALHEVQQCDHSRGHIVDSAFYGHRYATERSREIFCDRCRAANRIGASPQPRGSGDHGEEAGVIVAGVLNSFLQHRQPVAIGRRAAGDRST